MEKFKVGQVVKDCDGGLNVVVEVVRPDTQISTVSILVKEPIARTRRSWDFPQRDLTPFFGTIEVTQPQYEPEIGDFIYVKHNKCRSEKWVLVSSNYGGDLLGAVIRNRYSIYDVGTIACVSADPSNCTIIKCTKDEAINGIAPKPRLPADG